MCWLYALLIIIGAVIYAALTNRRDTSPPLKPLPKTKESQEDDLDELEMYIDELDEHGEPW